MRVLAVEMGCGRIQGVERGERCRGANNSRLP